MFRRKSTPNPTAPPVIVTPPSPYQQSNHSIPSSPIVVVDSPIKSSLPLNPVGCTGANAPVVKYSNGSVIESEYRLEKTIGKGSYGKVKLATKLSTNEKVALKFISRASIKKPTHWTRIRREINLLRAMHHPHIVKLYDYKDNGSDILLMMEYISGGDLFDRIVHHRDQRFTEKEARPLFRQIISAVDYCHQNRIIHRDLKPENLMVDDRNQIKLIDFGFANIYSPRGYLETNCGSPLYASPEIVQGVKYVGPEVDIWSLGVILFAMLTGTLPFEDEQLKGLYAKICSGNFVAPAYLSQEARDLIKMMLTVDPKQRATMKDIKFHPWVMNGSMYPPENFMPFRQPLNRTGMTMNAVREDVIAALEDYGFADPQTTRQMVLYQSDSPAYALYCLLMEREQRISKSRGVSLNTGGSANNKLPPLLSTAISTPAATAAYSPNPSPMASPLSVNPKVARLIPTMAPSAPQIPDSNSTSAAQSMSPSSGSNLVAQAAAHVASRFRKLRDLNFGRTTTATASAGAVSGNTVSSIDLTDSPAYVVPRAAAPFAINIPPISPLVSHHSNQPSTQPQPQPQPQKIHSVYYPPSHISAQSSPVSGGSQISQQQPNNYRNGFI